MFGKVLLVEPPFYRLLKDTYTLNRYPLSLGYLSGMIKKSTNWDAMVYNADFNINQNRIEPFKVSYDVEDGFRNYLDNLKDLSKPIWEKIRLVISEYSPDVIGISAKSQNFASASIVAKLAKLVNRKIFVVMGGPHPTMVGADVLGCPDIDACVKGEGEQTIVELLNALEHMTALDAVKGIVYRKDGQIVETASRELSAHLDSFVFPSENAPEVLKDYDRYPLSAFSSIFATRGCPYNCFFCGSNKIWGRKVRFRSPENVICEIKYLQNKGISSVHFDDDTFGVNKQYINELCDAFIKHCPGLRWSCEIHVKLVDEQTISLMKKSGCYLIQLGIESGSERILKQIRKGITVKEALSACKIIRSKGVILHTFFMLGFPWETESDIKDTVSVMKKSNSDFLIYSIFTPYPGTEAFEFCKENGLIDENYNSSLCYHHSPLNYFCMNIASQRFRELAREVEKMVDGANFSKLNRLKQKIRTFLPRYS